MRITSKGQVTIPLHIRKKAGLLPGCEIDFQLDEAGVVRLVRADQQPPNFPLERAIERLRGGEKRSTLPDFFIGAHAAVRGYAVLSRDWGRFSTYFPSVPLITP